MRGIGRFIVMDRAKASAADPARCSHGFQPGPMLPAQGSVGIPGVGHCGLLLTIPGGLFISMVSSTTPLELEIYGIKIRHRSRCLRPSVWPTPAADNRLPVRWTRAVDTIHTAAHAAAALKTAPEPLRFTLRNRRICTASGPYWRYALRRWGRAPGRNGGETRTQPVSVSQIPWYYYSIFKWGFPGPKSICPPHGDGCA